MRALDDLRRRHLGGTVAAVSHADVIRSAVLYVASTPLDLWYRVEISPASITSIAYDDDAPRLITVNETPGRWPDQLLR